MYIKWDDYKTDDTNGLKKTIMPLVYMSLLMIQILCVIDITIDDI